LDYVGFVYQATNKATGKSYIGRKNFKKLNRKPPLKSSTSKRKRKIISESNWATYTTSSKTINYEIKHGAKFNFRIISLHKTKSALNYNEVKQMILHDVMTAKMADGERAYYNLNIPAVRTVPYGD
jgi:hypothetical protein